MPARQMPARQSTVAGTWDGWYTCAQGPTGLHLVVSDGNDGDGALTARFHFFGLPQNPWVPDGEFTMTGRASKPGVVLRPDHWVRQPPGWYMVGLSGQLSDDDTGFAGLVVGPGCGQFALRRSS